MRIAGEHTGECRGTLMACLLLAAASNAMETVEVSRHMRPVQCDGFLMEWREADARAMGSVPGAAWDAANTADGLAGYVRVPMRDSCGPAGVLLEAGTGEVLGLLRFDGPSHGLAQAAVDSAQAAERVLEFVLPWDGVGLDSAGCYRTVLSLHSSCDNVQSTVGLAGCRGTLMGRVITPRIKTQIAVIVVLLTAYIVMSVRIRKKRTSRTQ